MKTFILCVLNSALLLFPVVASAQLLVFKGTSSDAYIGEGHTWRIASKTILVVDYSTGNFGRIDYTTVNGSKLYTTSTYTNSHIVGVNGPGGKPYSAVTRIPTDCEETQFPNREGLYFSGANAPLTPSNGGATVSFPKTINGSGRGFFYSSSTGQPVLSQGAILGVFSQTDSQARNQEGQSLESAIAGYITIVQGMGYHQ